MTEKTAVSTTDPARSVTPSAEKSLATRDEALYIAPPVDIFETEDALTVIADLPGVSKDAVDIRVEDDILTIKGKADYKRPANMILEEFDLHGISATFSSVIR